MEEFKKRLREFLESSDTGREAMAMSGAGDLRMQKLDGGGRAAQEDDDDTEI
jgi:hypothetical protein